MLRPTNNHGSIIAFALSAIAVMSITAALLTTLTILEVKKSASVERASVALYRAESGIENVLFLLNRAFVAGKTVSEMKTILGFDSVNDFGAVFDCQTMDAKDEVCSTNAAKLEVRFGARALRFDIAKNQALIMNIFEPNDKDKPPYDPYSIDTLQISGLAGDDSEKFEITFIAWNYQTKELLNPVKRLLKDTTDNSAPDGVARLQFPANEFGFGENEISAMGTTSKLIGIIRIRLIEPEALLGLGMEFYNGAVSSCDISAQNPAQCIPGFVDVVAIGEDDAHSNRQALKIVSTLPTGDNPASDIWDYVLFSNESLSK